MRFSTYLSALLVSILLTSSPLFAATLSGTVRDGEGNPVGGYVRLFDEAGDPLGDLNIDPSGHFQSWDLPDGTYYLAAASPYEKVDEAWNNIPCENLLCDITASTAIVLSGTDIGSIDFVLDPIASGGRILGLVTDASDNPLEGIGLELTNADGVALFYIAETGLDGQYETPRLADGTYYLYTLNEPFGLGRGLYDEAQCVPPDSCSDPAFVLANGSPIVISSVDQYGVDFSLEVPAGGEIVGQVSDAGLGVPLPDVHLDLLDEAGNYLANTNTDALGNYYFSGLEDGNYKVFAIWVPDGYTQELYGGDQCPDPSCDLSSLGTVITISGGEFSSGRDIALDYSGTRIFSTVTRSDSGDPVSARYAFAGIRLYDESGLYLGTWTTNSAGQAQITPPTAGTYYLVTSTDSGFHGLIDEVWNDIPCYAHCEPLSLGASPIAVAEGTTFVADFVLDPGFRISGTIQVEGSPSDQGYVHVWDALGNQLLTAWNDGGGNWISAPLPAGTYFATAHGEDSGLVSQLYEGVSCPQEYCDITAGSPIELIDADVGGVGFNLVPSSADWTISGSVRDGFGNPLGGGINIYDPFGNQVSGTGIDPGGLFQTPPLPNGTYFAVTVSTWEMLDEAWDDLPCENLMCEIPASTPIVIDGGNVTGIDFVLDPIEVGGHVSGQVTDAADNPVPGIGLVLHNGNGEYLMDLQADLSGHYQSPLLANDTYFVHTTNEPFGLGRELFDDIPCVPADSCYDPGFVSSSGTAINVVGTDVAGIDFQLEVPLGGQITGQLRDADLGVPLPDVHLDLLGATGNYLANTNTDAQGNFYFTGLTDGDYKVLAVDVPPGYTQELYGGDQCPDLSCDLATSGAVITVAGGAIVSGRDIEIDFAGTRIFGTVTRSDTGDPVAATYGHMGIDLFSETGEYQGTWATNSAGQFQINLPGAEHHYLRATNDWNYHGLVNEVWDDIKCYDGCDPIALGGTLVEVAEGSTFVANFVLDPMLWIDGSLRFEGVLTPDSWVNIWTATGTYVTTAGNDGTGHWRTGPLEAGTYYATAKGENWGMVSQLYYGISCPQEYCDFSTGMPIVLADAPVDGIDFDLVPQAGQWTISGSVLDGDGHAVPGVVRLFDPYGNPAGEFGIDGFGQFQIPDVADGTYFLITFGTDGMLDEAWNDIPCENLLCDVTASTPIVVSGGNVSGIDFVLQPILMGGRISGQVTDPTDAPLPGIGIMIRNSQGEYLFGLMAGADGHYESSYLANDTYFVHTTGEPLGLGRELYDDVKCLPADQCFDPAFVSSMGTAVVVDNSDPGGIDFKLEVPPGGQIMGQVTDAGIGVPLASIHLDLLNEIGHYQANTDTDAQGNFYFSGLPDGNYKVLAIGVPPGYTQELYGGDHCPDISCDLATSGAVIGISGGATVSGRDIALDYTGTRIFGSITRSDTGAPVSALFAHMGVDLFNESGDYLYTLATDLGGHYQFDLPGAGNYYLRAINDFSFHGLVNEVWDDIKCSDDCNPLTHGGTLIQVEQDSTFVADFVLDPEVILRDSFETP